MKTKFELKKDLLLLLYKARLDGMITLYRDPKRRFDRKKFDEFYFVIEGAYRLRVKHFEWKNGIDYISIHKYDPKQGTIIGRQVYKNTVRRLIARVEHEINQKEQHDDSRHN